MKHVGVCEELACGQASEESAGASPTCDTERSILVSDINGPITNVMANLVNVHGCAIMSTIFYLKFVRSLQPGISIMFRSLLWFK